VDEGLLDLTRFTPPDIHSSFYARQALGVKTFDIFDDVMGAYSVSVDNIYAIGGGGIGAGAKNRKAQRFKPVVTYLGPFSLKAGEKAVELDKSYGSGYNILGYAYINNNELDKASWAFDNFIRCEPNKGNPYDSKADLML